MARPKLLSNMTIAELEALLNERKSKLSGLHEQRAKLAAQLAALDKELAGHHGTRAAGGASSPTTSSSTSSSAAQRRRGGKRAKNSLSLVAMLEKVLTEAGKPVSVGDILDGVTSGGYKSSSANFRGLINQTLIKDKRFASAGRGLYEMKKS